MRTVSVPRASYFVSEGDEGRVRRVRDGVTAALGLLLMLWAAFASTQVPEWVSSLTQVVEASPVWVKDLLAIGYMASLIYALIVVGILIFGGPDRRPALRDIVIVVVGTGALAVLISFLVNDAWPYVLPEIGLDDPVPRYPVLRVALVTAMLLVASPYVARPLRRFGWLAIVTTAIASVALGYGSPVHAIGSFGIGLFSAGVVLLIVGTPRGYPSPASVRYGLQLLGVEASELAHAAEQSWGVVRFEARDGRGRALDVKVYGRDAFDSQLAAKIWRTLTYRELGRTVSYSRLQAVEHEALVTLLAGRGDVAVPELVTVGNASEELALIAFTDSGLPLDELDEAQLTDELLVRTWENVARLHGATISHGTLDSHSVVVLGDGPVITNFALGSLEPGDDDLAGDVVELLFSLSLLVRPERATRTALQGIGAQTLIDVLPYVQIPTVSSATRRRADQPKAVVAALKEAIASQTGAEIPEPVKLRRVTLRSLLMAGLLLLIASALVPLFTQVDYAEIWGVLQSANWGLIFVALLVGHTQYFPQATSTMFAVPAKLPFWPLVTLQTASQFISLAIPSAAGRVAMNAAFLHKFGVSVTVALAQGAIDGFSGFLVQALILIVIVLVGNVNLGLDIDTSDVPWLLILGVIALLVVGVVITVLRVKSLREKIVPVVSQAWGALKVVLQQPSRAIGLLTSNFVYWNVLGLTLWLLLQAVGSDLSYSSALFTAVGTSLLAGFMPVPGGVGVAEATMTAILATFGVDQATAFAVTASYRVITFYLPALEGFFGSRWLERNDYI